jgi:hypothetical protein
MYSWLKRDFGSLRPFFIKAMKEHNTCHYIYNVQMDELHVALNNIRIASKLHNKTTYNYQHGVIYFLIPTIHVVHL